MIPHVPAFKVPTIAFADSASDGSDTSTYTFSSRAIGAAAADRIVVVAAAVRDDSAGGANISSLTIGGVTATRVVTVTQNFLDVGIWALRVPSGTTADIVLNIATANGDRATIGVWAITGAIGWRPYETGSDTGDDPSDTLALIAGSVAVGFVFDANSGATPVTVGGLTQDFGAAAETVDRYAGGSTSVAVPDASHAVSFTVAGAGACGAAWAAWR